MTTSQKTKTRSTPETSHTGNHAQVGDITHPLHESVLITSTHNPDLRLRKLCQVLKQFQSTLGGKGVHLCIGESGQPRSPGRSSCNSTFSHLTWAFCKLSQRSIVVEEEEAFLGLLKQTEGNFKTFAVQKLWREHSFERQIINRHSWLTR